MASTAKKKRQTGMFKTKKDDLVGWLFTAPALICFLSFVLFPTLAMIGLSFTKYKMLRPPEWIGLDNYVRLFTKDAKLIKVALNTVKLSTVSVLISILIGLVLALLITSRKNGLYSYVIRSTFSPILSRLPLLRLSGQFCFPRIPASSITICIAFLGWNRSVF